MSHKVFKISGVSVQFPCKPYPSQFSMMDKILKGIERRQNCLLESPTGSGKSLALLCSALAWQAAEKEKKAQEEAQEFEKAQCTCDCHSEKVKSNPPSTTVTPKSLEGDKETEKCEDSEPDKRLKFGWPTFDLEKKDDNDDDDFKMDGKNLNLHSNKKSPRSHISISYEDEKTEKEILDKKSCELCECDPASSGEKVKTKVPKIFFGTRTHKQVAQIIRELRKTAYSDCKMTILGSREHTCIHPQVSKMKNKNDGCKELLNDQGGCRFKDATPRMTSQRIIKEMGLAAAWDLEELVSLCKAKRACPYFLSRGLKDDSDIIICPYNYLVDPMIREAMMINIKGHIIILDEAHNIEDSAREAASQSIGQDSILKGIKDIDDLIEQGINFADHSKLRSMLKNLDSFIDDNKGRLEQRDFDKSYKIWSGFYIVAQLENLGLGPKFFPDLKSALSTIKSELEERKEEAARAGLNQDLVQMKPATLSVLEQIFQVLEYLYRADLKYVDDYRASLVQSFQYVPRSETGQWLSARNRFGGRNMIQMETYTLNFWCMNPGVAFSDFADTRSIILTSGTLSPLTSFESELGLEFKIQLEANHVIKDSQVWVGTVGQGPGGGNLQAVFKNLETFTFQDELGSLVLKVCETVPHGVLCFLPSYKVLEKLITRWESIGLMQKIARKKRIISEPRGSDKVDFEEQMKLFYEAVQAKHDSSIDSDDDELASVDGAVFFAVCRGKVSEGLDFADNFARAVITVGIPYPNFKDVQVELKRKYNDQHRVARGLLSGSDWYEIQAFRALNQALGRCIRHRKDWGALIIVDDRFVKSPAKYCKGLSKWVRSKIQTFHNFPCVLDSLSLFTENMIDTQQNDNGLETSTLGSSPSPRKPLLDVNTPSTPKENFPIFNVFQTPASIKSTAKEVNKDSPTSIVSTLSTNSSAISKKQSQVISSSSPSSKLAERIKQQLSEKSSKPRFPYQAPDRPMLTSEKLQQGSDPAAASTASSSTTAAAPQSATTSSLSSWQTFDSRPPSVLNSNSKIQLRIVTERAAPGTRLQVFEIPQELHATFGGNLNLPVSTSERLVYLVDPPAGPGLNPTARLIRLSEAEKDAILAAQKKERNTARSSPSKPHEVTVTRKPNAPPAKDAAEADQVGPSALSKAEEQLRALKTSKAVSNISKTEKPLAFSSAATSNKNISPPASTTTTHAVPVSSAQSSSLSSHGVCGTSNAKLESDQTSPGIDSQFQQEPTGSKPPTRQQVNSPVGTGALSSGSLSAHTTIAPLIQAPGKTYQIVAQPNHSIGPLQKTNDTKNMGSRDFSDGVIMIKDNSPNENTRFAKLNALASLNTQNDKNVCDGISNPGILALPSSDLCSKSLHQAHQGLLTTAVGSDISPLLFTPSQSPHTPSSLTNIPKSTTPKSTTSNRKPMFKQQQSIGSTTSGKDQRSITQDKLTLTAASEGFGGRKLANVRHTPSKQAASPTSKTFPAEPSGEVATPEDSIQLKRKVKDRKRKGASDPKLTTKKNKGEKEESSFIHRPVEKKDISSVFKCVKCGHKLVTVKTACDVQEQRTSPPFLRDAFADSSHKTGCFFFSTSVGRLGFQTFTDSKNGMNTKYVEQEEICVQFLRCDQCARSAATHEQTQVVGAQVQLAAGSGARFSKGQMWLFYSGVRRETDEQNKI